MEGMERLGLIAARIRQNQGPIPRIEIDIILEELRNLYMEALQLESENVGSQAADPDQRAVEAKHQAEMEAARKAEEAKRKAEEEAARKAEEAKRKAATEDLKPIFAPETAETEVTPVIEPVMEEIEGNHNDELFAEPQDYQAKSTQKKAQESSLFDYFKNDVDKPKVRTLADTLNKHNINIEEQLETRVNAKKVDDLRTIININDKFSFMSELFHNNMKAYNDFIMRLNSYNNREEALAYVAEVAAQYMWHENSLVVKSFYKIFDRKF